MYTENVGKTMTDIKSLDKVELFRRLFCGAVSKGKQELYLRLYRKGEKNPIVDWTREFDGDLSYVEAKKIYGEVSDFDADIRGRAIRVDLSKDTVEFDTYDCLYGVGAGARIVKSMRESE